MRLQRKRFPMNFAKLSEHLFWRTSANDCFWRYSIKKLFLKTLQYSHDSRMFFHEHSGFTGLQGKGKGIYCTPLYHFRPLHRHLDISRAITAESSPLHIAGSRTLTGNLWLPSASRKPPSYAPFNILLTIWLILEMHLKDTSKKIYSWFVTAGICRNKSNVQKFI